MQTARQAYEPNSNSTIYSEAALAPYLAAAAEIVAPRPAIQHFTDGQTSALIIDSSQEAGRAALARWSHIPDEERARWAKPADTRTLEQVCADIDAAFGRGAK